MSSFNSSFNSSKGLAAHMEQEFNNGGRFRAVTSNEIILPRLSHGQGSNFSTRSTSSPVSPLLRTATIFKQKQREILELKELLESTGKERDNFEEIINNYKLELELAKDKISRLEKKNLYASSLNEELSLTKTALEKAEKENISLKLKVEELQDKINSLSVVVGRLQFDLSDATNHYENALKEQQGLYEILTNIRGQLRDEVQMHDFAREKLSKMENELAKNELKWQRKLDELHDELSAQKKNAHTVLLQQREEFAKTLETALIVKENYFRKICQLENELEVWKNNLALDVRKPQQFETEFFGLGFDNPLYESTSNPQQLIVCNFSANINQDNDIYTAVSPSQSNDNTPIIVEPDNDENIIPTNTANNQSNNCIKKISISEIISEHFPNHNSSLFHYSIFFSIVVIAALCVAVFFGVYTFFLTTHRALNGNVFNDINVKSGLSEDNNRRNRGN